MEQDFFVSSTYVTSDRILHTPSTFARSALFYLQEVGTLKALASHTSKRSNLLSYLFFVVIEGEGELYYNTKKYELHAGDCVFIDCKKEYSHTTGYIKNENQGKRRNVNDSGLWRLQWVHFYGQTIPSIYNKYIERGGQPVFHLDSITHVSKLISNIQEIASSSDYIRDMRINEQLSALLTFAMEESWHPENVESVSQYSELFVIKNYLDEHFKDKITLDTLSELFFIDKYYLTRIFKKKYGITINNYILSKRITCAKQFLRFSDSSIDKIGFECGFGDCKYFCRMFKKIEGISPGEYRKMW